MSLPPDLGLKAGGPVTVTAAGLLVVSAKVFEIWTSAGVCDGLILLSRAFFLRLWGMFDYCMLYCCCW